MRYRMAAVGIATLLITMLSGGATLGLQPLPSPRGLDGVEVGSSHTFNMTDGARVHVAPLRTSGTGPGAGSGTPGPRQTAVTAGTTGNGINYNGGPIVPAERAVAIYWASSTIYTGGPTPGTSGAGSTDGSLVGYFLSHLAGSTYYNINTTYFDTVSGGHTVGNSLAYTAYWADNASAPSGSQSVSDAAIQAEITGGFASGKLTYDPSTVYAVFSSGAVNLGGGAFTQYCAYHGDFRWNGNVVLYAVMPYDNAVPAACSAQLAPNGDPAADAEVNTLAHELEEANTDPQLNAWFDSSGNENADKCAWIFGSTTLSGGKANIAVGADNFLVQENWLNASGGACAQGYSTTPATVPGAPTLNSATAGASSVALAWSAPASNGGASITGYKVYRSTVSGGEGSTPYATVGNVTSYTDSAATAGSTWYYTLAAVNSMGTGAQSNERSTTPTSATIPGAPTLSASRSSRRGIQLNWTAPASNGSPLTAYWIYRSTSTGTETLLVQRSASSTSYRDTGTTSGHVYYYKVVAVNAIGHGPFSNEASATAR